MTAGDLVILLIVSALIILSTYSMYRDKVNGKGCGGGCSGCSGKSCSASPVIQITDEVKKD